MLLLRWLDQQRFQQLLQQPAVYACMLEQSFHGYKGIAHEGACQPARPKMKEEKSDYLRNGPLCLSKHIPPI